MTTPFIPAYGSGSGSITLAAGVEQHFRIEKDNPTLRVINTGATNPLYFKTYNSGTNAVPAIAPAVPASTADYRMHQDTVAHVGKDRSHDAISLISAVGTTVEFMTGIGGV